MIEPRWNRARMLLLCGAVAVMAACALNPATGKRQLALMSEGQEIQMGRQANQEILTTMAPYEDADLQEYINRLGQKLAALSERPDLPWTFTVIDDPAVNAFALPGGFIYITRGILTHMTSEAQAASVLGHEIGHVTARHSVEQYSKAQLANVGLFAGMILAPDLRGLGQLAQSGLSLLFLRFGRDAEREADDLALRYLTRARFDPGEMVKMFRTLEQASAQETGGRLPEWLSTHPSPGNRVARTAAGIRKLPAGAETGVTAREEFLKRLDRMAFGEDPREGFFEGTAFYHPGMAFQMRMPQGWKTQNQTQGVAAVSPDQDAAIVLTMARGSSPVDAARGFFSQPGVQPGTTSQDNIHGLSAVTSTFLAQQQQGAVQGIAAFIDHHGRVFEVLGYTPAPRFERYARTLAEAVTSFAPLRDPEYLNVQPKRVRIVRMAQPMTLEEFARRHPSTVDLKTLRLINQVNEGEQLVAGRRYKRVAGGQLP